MSRRRALPERCGAPSAIRYFAAAALILLLGACVRYPPAVPVAFPDDPRVLHGTWDMTVTGLAQEIDTFYLDGAAQHLIIWPYAAEPLAFTADGTGDYLEVDAAAFGSLTVKSYDAALEAVVSLKRAGSNLTVRVVPLAGGAATEVVIPVPPELQLLEHVAGGGNVFMVLQGDAGVRELHWWNSLTGAAGGSLTLPRFSDNVRVSHGGRAIMLWDLNGWKVNVIDTAAPRDVRVVPLGACRGNAVSEVSHDGRWLVIADCFDNLRVADLDDPAAGSSALGSKLRAGLGFAVDSPELVWIDTSGIVRSLDVETGQRDELHTLSTGEIARADLEWPWWRTPLYLNREQGILALAKGDGRVTLVGLGPAAPSVALPRPAFDSATLELQAVLGDTLLEGYSSYSFSGVTELTGVPLQVTGEVMSTGLHEYRPGSAGLGAQARPPPRTSGSAEFSASGAEDPAYHLFFGTTDRNATAFAGELESADGGERYTVTLQRED